MPKNGQYYLGMPLPAIVAAAARILGPMLAEGAGAAVARGGAAAGRSAAGAAEGRASQQVLTKFDAAMNRNPPPSIVGRGPPGQGDKNGWVERGFRRWADSNLGGGGGGGGPPGGGGGGDGPNGPNRPFDFSGL